MIRTQVQLTEKQARALKRAAAARGVSMSALIRDAVDQVVGDQSRDRVWERALDAVGRLRGNAADVSEEHDRHLADAYGR